MFEKLVVGNYVVAAKAGGAKPILIIFPPFFALFLIPNQLNQFLTICMKFFVEFRMLFLMVFKGVVVEVLVDRF